MNRDKITYTDNLGNEFIADIILPCPFCGGDPVLEMIGNNFSKTKKARIKCKKCRVQRVDAAIRNDQVWCGKMVIEQWNERIILSISKIVICDTQRANYKDCANWRMQELGCDGCIKPYSQIEH